MSAWVNKLNDEVGVPPSFDNVAAERGKLESTEAKPSAAENDGRQRTIKWVWRWRRRWGAVLGRVKTQVGGNAAKVPAKAS